MNHNQTIEVTTIALRLLVEYGGFGTTEIIHRSEDPLSISDVESVLQHLQEAGWIERSTDGEPTWEIGPTGQANLQCTEFDQRPFRVLPGEVPDDESVR